MLLVPAACEKCGKANWLFLTPGGEFGPEGVGKEGQAGIAYVKAMVPDDNMAFGVGPERQGCMLHCNNCHENYVWVGAWHTHADMQLELAGWLDYNS